MERKNQVRELARRFGKDLEASLVGLTTEEQLLVTSVFNRVIPLFKEHSQGYYEKFYLIYEVEILQKLRNKANGLKNLRLTDYFDQGSFKLLDLQTEHKIDYPTSSGQFLSNTEYDQFLRYVLKLINHKQDLLLLDEPKSNKKKMKESVVENLFEGEEMEKHGDREEYITIKECAKFLKCSEVTIHAYKKNGMPFLQSGRTVRFLKSEVLAYMRKEGRGKGKGKGGSK